MKLEVAFNSAQFRSVAQSQHYGSSVARQSALPALSVRLHHCSSEEIREDEIRPHHWSRGRIRLNRGNLKDWSLLTVGSSRRGNT